MLMPLRGLQIAWQKRRKALPNVPRSWQQARPGRYFANILAAALLMIVFAPCHDAVARQRGGGDQEIPAPEDIELTTRDGVILHATYFPGTEEKDTVPVILLHDYQGQRGQFLDLAKRLQEEGHAVLVPDLRGHGESTEVEGMNKPLRADRLTKQQFYRMVEDDVETLKRFLIRQNNEEQLNIDKLCVVGAGMGAVVAINWAALDWSWPPLATGKQGQDVKALVLISPPQVFRGLSTKNALTTDALQKKIAIFLAVGRDDRRALAQAKRIYTQLQRRRTPQERRRTPQEREQLRTIGYRTSLQGVKLLKKEFPLEDHIVKFINEMVASQKIPWAPRKPPVE